MSIFKAVANAYKKMEDRGWDTIYWAVDLHGVCLKANYANGGYEWINEDAPRVLKLIADRPESRIILWSSVYDNEKAPIWKFFNLHGILLDAFNNNPYERNTAVSSFHEKFYFSILLDDKAGFDPDFDWREIERFYRIRAMKDAVVQYEESMQRCAAGDFA